MIEAKTSEDENEFISMPAARESLEMQNKMMKVPPVLVEHNLFRGNEL